MISENQNAELERELIELLNPVQPSNDFIDELQKKLRIRNLVNIEYPNILLTIILISSGLFLGIAVIWGLSKIFKVVFAQGKESQS